MEPELHEVFQEIREVRQSQQKTIEEFRALKDRLDNVETVYIHQLKEEINALKEPIETSQSDRKILLAVFFAAVVVISTRLTVSQTEGSLSWQFESGVNDSLIIKVLEISGIASVVGAGAYTVWNAKIDRSN